jgi:predicted nuclease of predicted toxin-antitoxin system
MKLLLDTCVWGGAKADLEAAGYDVVWCGDWEQDPVDEEQAQRAQRLFASNRIFLPKTIPKFRR